MSYYEMEEMPAHLLAIIIYDSHKKKTQRSQRVRTKLYIFELFPRFFCPHKAPACKFCGLSTHPPQIVGDGHKELILSPKQRC